jgi:Putative peptidoglycan binding domain/D-alanyl-D-alanine carboxypeptidase
MLMSQWTETIPFDNSRFTLNGDLQGARNRTMLELLGNPRGSYSQDCQGPTNARISRLIAARNVGPFTVRGLKPAVDTLEQILAVVKDKEPDIHSRLGHVGMLCCRFVRGSNTAISNHSWGTAIDLTIDGVLDERGNKRAQKGLMQIFKHFNAFGFFWGVAFPTEDAMHFEASEQLMRKWAADGKLGDVAVPAEDDTLEIGDRSAKVAEIQKALGKILRLQIEADGVFGPATRAAVIMFQTQNGLKPDGMVGAATLAKIKAAG